MPRCRVTRLRPISWLPRSRWGSPSRSFQHGYAVRSAVVSYTQLSRGDWLTHWASRWGGEDDYSPSQGHHSPAKMYYFFFESSLTRTQVPTTSYLTRPAETTGSVRDSSCRSAMRQRCCVANCSVVTVLVAAPVVAIVKITSAHMLCPSLEVVSVHGFGYSETNNFEARLRSGRRIKATR